METILSDGTVLEDLATYDKTLWEKIKEWIETAIRKIKEAFEGVSPNSQAAKVLADSMDSLTELQEMFATAARKTGERTKAAGVDVEVKSGGNIVYSVSDEKIKNASELSEEDLRVLLENAQFMIKRKRTENIKLVRAV